MNTEEYRKTVNDLIYLCRCAVNMEIPADRLYNLDQLYNLSRKHMLTSMVGFALDDAGIEDKKFKYAVLQAQRKTIILNNEKSQVFAALDSAGIWHMALKGTILRDWYPKFGMRESADCDILIDKTHEETVREIMMSLGYTVESYGDGHHDVYFKKPVTNMQMHVELFGTGFDKRLNDYYSNLDQKLLGDSYEKEFTSEDFYIYLMAHNHRDYTNGGAGLRTLLDTYVLVNRFDYDWNYIRRECKKLGIEEFEKSNRTLADNLFSGIALTEADELRLDYMIGSGAYGTIDNVVSNKVKNYGGGYSGKFLYVIHRLIVPMDVIKHTFPVFYKYKILLPLLPVYRTIRGVRKNRKKILSEAMALTARREKRR